MKYIYMCMCILLLFTCTVYSEQSEVSYVIYYDSFEISLVDEIKHVEKTYNRITSNTKNDMMDKLLRESLDEFKNENIHTVEYKNNVLYLYIGQNNTYSYEAYFQRSCSNKQVIKKSILNIW